jgi:hypothetical protein
MALAFEIDSLDGLEESVKTLYKEHNGKFRLDVSGIDPADELKGALQREREERKAAKARADQLEREKAEAEEVRLREKSEFKELYEREKSAAQKLKEEWEAEKLTTKKEKISNAALQIGAELGDQESSVKLLTREAKDYIEIENGVVKYLIGGVEVTKEVLVDTLAKQYPQLCKGSGASGGGAAGGKNGGAAKKPEEYSEAERMQLYRSEPAKFNELFGKK